MTKDEILAMKPGRELDTLVAEKIFGLEYMECIGCYIDTNGNEQKIKRYSVEIAAAWEVVEKLKVKKLYPAFAIRDQTYNISIWDKGGVELITDWVRCKTAPEAICKAALVAVSKVGDVDGL